VGAENMTVWLGWLITAVWAIPILVLICWDFYLSAQMLNYRVPKERPIFGGRKFSFQTDAADYSEIGQVYRRKSIRVEIALLIWGPGVFIILSILFAK
jgi:hypothetical protein